MKEILLPLTVIMCCAATFQSAAADPAVPLQVKQGEESHAVVTDLPDIIDMSHADPRTWESLPPAAQVNSGGGGPGYIEMNDVEGVHIVFDVGKITPGMR